MDSLIDHDNSHAAVLGGKEDESHGENSSEWQFLGLSGTTSVDLTKLARPKNDSTRDRTPLMLSTSLFPPLLFVSSPFFSSAL